MLRPTLPGNSGPFNNQNLPSAWQGLGGSLDTVPLEQVHPKPRSRTKCTCPQNRNRRSIKPSALVLSVSFNLIRTSIILLKYYRQDNAPPKDVHVHIPRSVNTLPYMAKGTLQMRFG